MSLILHLVKNFKHYYYNSHKQLRIVIRVPSRRSGFSRESRYGDKFNSKLRAKRRKQVVKLISGQKFSSHLWPVNLSVLRLGIHLIGKWTFLAYSLLARDSQVRLINKKPKPNIQKHGVEMRALRPRVDKSAGMCDHQLKKPVLR